MKKINKFVLLSLLGLGLIAPSAANISSTSNAIQAMPEVKMALAEAPKSYRIIKSETELSDGMDIYIADIAFKKFMSTTQGSSGVGKTTAVDNLNEVITAPGGKNPMMNITLEKHGNSWALKYLNSTKGGTYFIHEVANNKHVLHFSAAYDDVNSSFTFAFDNGNATIKNGAGYNLYLPNNNDSFRFDTKGAKNNLKVYTEYDRTNLETFIATNITKDIAYDNNQDTDACRGENGYYAVAKKAFSALPSYDQYAFMTDSTYSQAKDRLMAWAKANNETIALENDNVVIKPQASNLFLTYNNSTLIITIVSISIAAITCIAFITFCSKKRARKN